MKFNRMLDSLRAFYRTNEEEKKLSPLARSVRREHDRILFHFFFIFVYFFD